MRQNIFDTVLYYDILGFALSLDELVLYSSAKSKQEAMDYIQKHPDIFYYQDGYVCYKGSDHLIQKRKDRKHVQKEKWDTFSQMLPKLSKLPFIELMSASGSFALGSCKQDSDLDVLIITSPNRIATTRLCITLWTRILWVKRIGNTINDHLCLNHYFSKDHGALTPHNIYTARLYSRLIPVMWRPWVCAHFVSQNQWMQSYMPKWPYIKNEPKHFLQTRPGYIEKALSGPLGDIIERVLFSLQYKRFIKKRVDPDYEIMTKTEMAFHPMPQEPQILQTFEKKKEEVLKTG